ncbi:hypothetical protein ABT147_12355 [Streptomyces sp. NPDC001868]
MDHGAGACGHTALDARLKRIEVASVGVRVGGSARPSAFVAGQ